MYSLSLLILSAHLTYMDLRYRRIPNSSLLFFALSGLFLGEFNFLLALISLILFLPIRWVSKNQIGMGDVKLISTLALGCAAIDSVISSIWIASASALVVVVANRLINGFWCQSLPFAPFLCLGFLLSR